MTKEKARPGSGRLAKSNRNEGNRAPETDARKRKRWRGRKAKPQRAQAPAPSPALTEEARRREAMRAEAEQFGVSRKRGLAFLALVYRHERGQPSATWRDYVCHCGERARMRKGEFPECRANFRQYWRCPYYLEWRAAREHAGEG